MSKHKRTICLDFDGVVHSYVSGWKGVTSIPDAPVPGAKEAIDTLRAQGYEVVIFSTRSSTPDGLYAMQRWLEDNGIHADRVSAEKPPALIYVDDRGLKFDGDWPQTLQDISGFRHYMEKVRDV